MPTSKGLAYTLQVKNTAGSMQEASGDTLAAKLAEYGPAAPAKAQQVRRFLISGQPDVEESLIVILSTIFCKRQSRKPALMVTMLKSSKPMVLPLRCANLSSPKLGTGIK